MYKRIIGVLNCTKSLYKKQYGFQKHFATAHLIISLIEHVEKELDNKLSVCGIFIDLQKSFDTVDHKLLLHKPTHCRIRNLADCWFFFYFFTRKQFATI